jgi:MFS family permease
LSAETHPSQAVAVRTVGAAVLVATIVACSLSLTVALISVRLDEAGFSARAIGLNAAAAGVAALLTAPLVPWAARRLGVATLLILALLLGAGALLGLAVTHSYIAWLGLRFLMGVAFTAEFVLSEFWITASAPARSRGLAIGFYGMSFAGGFALGPLTLAAIGTSGNLPFYLAAGLMIAAIGPLALNARSAPALDVQGELGAMAVLRQAPAATLASLLQGAVEAAGMGLLPVYALRSGLDPSQGALLAALFILGAGAFQVPLGLLADRVAPHRLLLILAGLGIVGALLLAGLGVRWLVLAEGLLLLWGGLVCGLYPVGLSHLAQLFRGANLARASAGFVTAYSIGMLVGPPFVGFGLDLAPSGFFLSIAVLLATYVMIVAPHWRK